MRRFLACLTVLAILLTSLATVSVSAAEEKKVAEPWTAVLGSVEVSTSTDKGDTVYSFGGMSQPYHSAGLDILPTLKTLITGRSSITVEIRFDAKVEYAAGYEDEDYNFGLLVRAGSPHEKIADPSGFQSLYSGGRFYDTGGGNYALRLIDAEVLYGEWESYAFEGEFSANDINAGLWKKLNLCFDRMDGYEIASKINVKNTVIEVIDYREGSDQPTIDLSGGGNGPGSGTVVGGEVDLNVPNSVKDTPELPDGNLYPDAEWATSPYSQTTKVTKGEYKGKPMYSITGFNKTYSSPAIDVFPKLKEAIGDEDEMEVWIVFDIRCANSKGNEGSVHDFGVKLRVSGLTALTQTQDAYDENYASDSSTFPYVSEGQIHTTLKKTTSMTEDWMRVEMMFTYNSYDVNDELWSKWYVCFDNLASYETLGALQVKNFGIYTFDDYDPIEVEIGTEDGEGENINTDTSVKPAIIYKPYNFNKYHVTFADAVPSDQSNEGGNTNNGTGNENKPSGDNGTGNENKPSGDDGGAVTTPEKKSNVGIIIGVIAGVVIIAGGVVAFVVIKKKNEAVKEEE